MTTSQALRTIRYWRPKSPEDFREIGLPVTFIDNGVFREVCKIDGLRLIVKFPIASDSEGTDFSMGKKHSRGEFRRINKLMKFPVLRPHLPKVRYYDDRSGIIVMDWYEKFVSDDDKIVSLGNVTEKLIHQLTKVRCSDIHAGNILCKAIDPSTGRRGDAIFIDLGF